MFLFQFPLDYIRFNYPVINKENRFPLLIDKVLSVIIKF